MTDPSSHETDALSALSALASQEAPFQPTYPYLANDDDLAGSPGDGSGHSRTRADESSMSVDDPPNEWHASDAQALAQVLAQQRHMGVHALEGGSVEHVDGLVDMDEDGTDVKLEYGGPHQGNRTHLLGANDADVVSAIEAAARAAEDNASPAIPLDNAAPRAAKKPRTTRSVNTFATRWLTENYQASPETSLQRASMYASYSSVCNAHEEKIISTASFGKAVRAAFPGLKTRRLGTRKNSKYCYTGLQAFSEAEVERLQQFDAYFAQGGEVPAVVWPTERKAAKKPWEQESEDDHWDGEEEEEGENGDGELSDEIDDPADLILRVPSDRPTTVRAKRKPKQKTRPKTVHITELEVNGRWVQHVKNEQGELVPCDPKGEPLPPPELRADRADVASTAIEPDMGNTQASSSSHPLSNHAPLGTSPTPSSQRPKRSRASVGRATVASMLDEIDSDSDEPSESTPSGRGKKRAAPDTEDRSWSQISARQGKKGKPGPKLKTKGGPLAHVTPEEKKHFIDLAAGLDRLRDAVPALRALFQTSTAQTAAVDQPDAKTGLIDGLAPLSGPSDGKITIVKAARTYIHHLDEERHKTDKQLRTLEEFILKNATGQEALDKWRDSFAEDEKVFAQQEQERERIAALPIQPNALAGPSGLDSDGKPLKPAQPANGPPVVDGQDVAAFARAALAPTDGRSESVATDGPISSAGREEPKRNARTDDAREKNRVKQRLYRERQKAKLQELESKIHRMEAGETPTTQLSTAGPTRQQEQLRALRQQQEQLIGQEQRDQHLDDHPDEPESQDAVHERNRLLVQDHIERATQQPTDGPAAEQQM